MNRIRTLAAMIVCLALCTALSVRSDESRLLDRSRLAMTFAEEFNAPPSFYDPVKAPGGRWKTNFAFGIQDPLSPRSWETRTLRPNNELQYYGDPFRGSTAFEWQGGWLRIVGQRAAGQDIVRSQGLPFVSGLITTEKSFQQAYGYFEARVRMPVGKGLWPAFWLLPRFQPQGAPTMPQPLAEVDVVENIGRRDQVFMSAHYGTREKPGHDVKEIAIGRVDEPHVYGVLMTKSDLVWYIDDVEVRRTPNRDFHEPAYMLLNLAIGGDWPGAPDESTAMPARMEIDWVRAYALKPGANL